MTVVLAFMGVGIFLSLLVSHVAMRLSEALLTRRSVPPWEPEIDDRLKRDQRYARLL